MTDRTDGTLPAALRSSIRIIALATLFAVAGTVVTDGPGPLGWATVAWVTAGAASVCAVIFGVELAAAAVERRRTTAQAGRPR